MELIAHIVISILALATVILATNNKLLKEDMVAIIELLRYWDYYRRLAANNGLDLGEDSPDRKLFEPHLKLPNGHKILAPRHILIALEKVEDGSGKS